MKRFSIILTFVASSIWISTGVNAQDAGDTADTTTSQPGIVADGQVPTEVLRGREHASVQGRPSEPRNATGFTEEERQAMRERRQLASEDERAAAQERAAQRRNGQAANNGQFPGGGNTEGAFPGRGATEGVFPGGGRVNSEFPGRGQTRGTFPGRGQTSGAFPGGARGSAGGAAQRGSPRGGMGR